MVISDSLVAIRWLQEKFYVREERISRIIDDIRAAVEAIESTVYFCWTKGHNDTYGNDVSDDLAKTAVERLGNMKENVGTRAAYYEMPSFEFFGYTAAKTEITQRLKQQVATRFEEKSHTFASTEKLYMRKKFKDERARCFKHEWSLLNRLRTGHIHSGFWLHHMRFSQTDRCGRCNTNAIENVHHMLCECDHFEKRSIRQSDGRKV